MILHYGGKYDGNENSLPHKDHHPNAVPFREADDMRKMSLIANVGCILIMLLLVMLEPGEIDHFESARNDQSRLIRNSQCTSMTN